MKFSAKFVELILFSQIFQTSAELNREEDPTEEAIYVRTVIISHFARIITQFFRI